MSRQKRRAIYGVFCFGTLRVLAKNTSFKAFFIPSYKTYGVLGEHGDPFWVGMIAIITVYAETFALVIVSCIPALSTFYIGTFTKSRFYLTLKYGILYRLRRSEASNFEAARMLSISECPNANQKSHLKLPHTQHYGTKSLDKSVNHPDLAFKSYDV
ncbi:uncharacterized protein EAE97_006376 [Botrytis byssoidea]|uniref:Uncharacterized protein n=1 Tax=Botrytis byssoidea TaxID=139641 RepID=A0A9P5LUM0_9HELO|nr:uncharacterized protein EAE97_006376 [Botrytis byssoidea]KAF7942922.1 hypothetical protein EAE97_006376 [Botrytis byssoidea]